MARKGFFSASTLTAHKPPPSKLARCGECGLYKTCLSPKMPYTGKGRRKILIVAEAPGKDEDTQGVQLIGDAGQYLRKVLRGLKIDLDKDCWKTNANICRPVDNATPTDKQIMACRPHLMKTIMEVEPETIILLGGTAVKSLIGPLWKESVGALNRWLGWHIPCQQLNAWVCPTYHPSYLLRTHNEVAELFFRRHLEVATSLHGRPWEVVPDFRREISILFDVKKAAAIIRKYVQRSREQTVIAALDYEADRIKPDNPDSRIVSCAICFEDKRTIAFPWTGEAIQAVHEFQRSPIRKIASNMKYEDRWTRAILGIETKAWWWDTMLAAHIINPQKDITGLKFQAFSLLGMESYNDHIEPFFKAKVGQNRIADIDLHDLLLYNGLDALLEYKVAMVQRRLLGYT